MKKKDFITIISILALILLCFWATKLNSKEQGQYVKITQNNNLVGNYPLDAENTIPLDGCVFVINNGSISMKEANCPDGLCLKQHSISNIGEQIVCLPNKAVASIYGNNSPISRDSLYFNTYINITIYDSEDESILDNIMEMCSKYEKICSRTNREAELYKLNHRLIIPRDIESTYPRYPISAELYDMISIGLEYGKFSNDAFNIAIAPVTELWNFTDQSNYIPSDTEIQTALIYCNTDNIILNTDGTISFTNENIMIDLGGIAKGYIADRIKEYLLSENISSATISLGGNILCLGNKYGKPFNIGITKPFDKSGKSIKTIEITDKSVVTSGIYERYFEKDGIIYHHIIDSQTGYPIQNGIQSITIISNNSVDGDCLSTWLFSLGKDAALNYANSHPEIDIIIVDSNNKVVTTLE